MKVSLIGEFVEVLNKHEALKSILKGLKDCRATKFGGKVLFHLERILLTTHPLFYLILTRKHFGILEFRI